MDSWPSLFIALSIITGSGAAAAEDLTIRVAPNDKLSRALERASEHLASCKSCTVTIQVAGGEQRGKAGVGRWTFPETVAPGAALRILGGFDARFETRAPFTHPTVLVISGRRSDPVLQFEGKRPALKELQLSGFAIDVGAGNSYDAKTGALFKGSSSSWPILAFGSLAVDRLIISDNLFMNAANGVASPRINPASDASEVIIRNNLFVNNVYCWQVAGLPTNRIVKRYLVEGNSFIGNFPYNPATGTSNPGALEIGNQYSAAKVEIRGNLFAYNSGGAIFPQWEDKVGPKLEISDNLFFKNGTLFGDDRDGGGAVVGKFNGSGVHASFTPEEIEADFSWTTLRNQIIDPELPRAPKSDAAEPDDEERPETDESGLEIVRSEAIDSFARRASFDLGALPFPRSAAAAKYGASASRIATP